MDYCSKPVLQPYLAHHGIKGQRWGIRRYQNLDGTWTNAGKERYGDSSGESGALTGKTSISTKRKAAIGMAVVTGTVLTAYLVKKYGGRNISDVANGVSVGKEILQDILKTTPVSTMPVSQLPIPKVKPKQVIERVAKSTPVTSSPVSQISASKVSASKLPSSVPPPYSFDSLMRQNNDLLKKMLAEIA